MSGFAQSARNDGTSSRRRVQRHFGAHPRCIYDGEADQIPVHYSAFQKQRLGWLSPNQLVTHWGGEKTYHLSAPTFNPNGGDSPLQRLKMVHVKIPSSTAYYAIDFRRGARPAKTRRPLKAEGGAPLTRRESAAIR